MSCDCSVDGAKSCEARQAEEHYRGEQLARRAFQTLGAPQHGTAVGTSPLSGASNTRGRHQIRRISVLLQMREVVQPSRLVAIVCEGLLSGG